MQWLNGCTGKTRYKNGEVAVQRALKNIASWGVQRTYRCNHCKGWHLTRNLHTVDVDALVKQSEADHRAMRMEGMIANGTHGSSNSYRQWLKKNGNSVSNHGEE